MIIDVLAGSCLVSRQLRASYLRFSRLGICLCVKCCVILAGSSQASFSGSTSCGARKLCESTHHFAGMADRIEDVLGLRAQSHLLLLSTHPPSILF